MSNKTTVVENSAIAKNRGQYAEQKEGSELVNTADTDADIELANVSHHANRGEMAAAPLDGTEGEVEHETTYE